ncbi:MAG TPA: dCTP deaminase [Candidatus Bipolaricaulota bacterium]|nr:dCTP deaminase [Candidatus Bipolaricaulota bacterium]
MLLDKKTLLDLLKENKITFEPNLDGFQIQPNSIDLRLGHSFYIPVSWKLNEQGRVAMSADYLDYHAPQDKLQLIKLKPGQYFEILPHEFIMISTLEKISLNNDNIVGNLQPRSTALRRGLQITGGAVDVHYSGHLIIPMVNNTNHILRLYPGERICQLQFFELKSPLSVEEAKKHGLQDAKYNEATPYGLEAKSDSQEEIDLIKAGKIDELKSKYQNL